MYLSMSSGTIYEVIRRHSVSGLTSVRLGVRFGNQVVESLADEFDHVGSGEFFSVSDLTGVWFSTRRLKRGRPEVSPCHRV
jgi:hypothetical protein